MNKIKILFNLGEGKTVPEASKAFSKALESVAIACGREP